MRPRHRAAENGRGAQILLGAWSGFNEAAA